MGFNWVQFQIDGNKGHYLQLHLINGAEINSYKN